MIFYKALKYKILEFCVDSMFNSIFRNFSKSDSKVGLKDLRRGMRVSYLEEGGRIYTDCYFEFINRIEVDLSMHGITAPVYYAYILCRDTNIPEDERYATDERTGHYLFELRLFEGECKIIL